MKRLNEVLDLNTGLFRHIVNPLWEGRYENFDLDLEFITSYGNRPISPLVSYYDSRGPITEDEIKQIINLVYRKNLESWTRKYQVLSTVYEILDNYNMIEREEIDRDTLETNMNELIRDNKEARNQINDLFEQIERNDKNELNRLNKEDVSMLNSTDSSESVKNIKTADNENGTVDALTFNNRKDVESRNLTKEGTNSGRTGSKESDSLSFIGRQDDTTDGGSTTDKGSTTSTGSATKNNTDDIENESKVFGFNSANSVRDRETGGTSNSNESNREDGNIKIDNLKHDNRRILTDKRGTELNSKSGDITTNANELEKDTGSIERGKQGQEVNNKNEQITIRESDSTNRNQSSNELSNNNTKQDFKDVGVNKGSTDTTRLNTINDTLTVNGSETETRDVEGQYNEDRVLTRSGNIGVMTTAQMLQQHIEMWNYTFLDDVYEDTIKMLGLSIY